MNIERWTSRDEHQLQTLLKRKEELMDKNTKPVIELVAKFQLKDCGETMIAERLIENADAFRDALEPFDSGARCVQASQQL